ncbi:MAG: type II toxin-antitoxin system PemK/MazF family toxin [Cardiobacteriaceae bacterium]|nr:type II toxin-antitoxin system PemK/MazF family toxin [Cardiobacteriaceae bacterium]
MSNYIPEQGDIVFIDFDPSSGKEIQKRRPGLVMSKSQVARKTGLILVCPITSTRRGIALEVEIDTPTVQGVALSIQIKALDYRQRHVVFAEKADWHAVETMSLILQELVAI